MVSFPYSVFGTLEEQESRGGRWGRRGEGNDYPLPTCLNFFFLVENSIVGVGGIDVTVENTRSC